MAIRRDLDGFRVRSPGEPHIYLIDRGEKRLIPDPMTYNNLFRNWSNINQNHDVLDIDTGLALPEGAVLMQGFTDHRIFLIDQMQKRHIASPLTMDRYDFDYNKIQHIAQSIVEAILTGDEISWSES